MNMLYSSDFLVYFYTNILAVGMSHCKYNIIQTSWCIFILIFIAVDMCTVNIIFSRFPGVFLY